ncbi:MAG TPA: serine/threonine-protein kinase [Gemmataceae bacterium]|jgi:hypothetical protein
MSEWPAEGDDSLYHIDRLCDAFEDAWQAGQRPRVVEFLAGVEETLRAALLRELLRLLAHYLPEDQRRRWQQGERVSVRQYLHETPQLHEEPELVFGLICDEVLLREELSDTPPHPEDYLDLLPSHEVQLRHFFADRRARHQATHNVSSGKATLQCPTVAVTLTGVVRSSVPAAPPLDRYQPGGFIGRGGMGDVFWVHDPHLGRDLAIKVLREDRREPPLVRRFLEEARLHSQLQHPNVAPVHELGEALDGRPFFTMKLIKGRALDELLKDRAGPAEDLLRFLGIFEQICQALAYAHAQGVIHRDLKPHNVMVDAFGEVQVMDWGLAKVLCRVPEVAAPAGQETLAPAALADTVDADNGTQPGDVLGTLAYMPPAASYNAACAAALAAAGQGENAMKLTDEERARWRKQALDWLRADLAAWTKMASEGTPSSRRLIAQALQQEQIDPDLVSLRDKDAVDKLPEAERDACQKLWADVETLRRRTV